MRSLVIALVCSIALGTVSVEMSSAAQKGKPGGQFGQKNKGQKGSGQKGRMDPSGMAARMIQQFDKNGDKALNAQELTAALTKMRERRGQMGQGKGGGKGKGGFGKGKGKGGAKNGPKGGVTPKKPGGN